jgi:hypothetical protein
MPLPTKHADVEPEANSGEVHATECRIRNSLPGSLNPKYLQLQANQDS